MKVYWETTPDKEEMPRYPYLATRPDGQLVLVGCHSVIMLNGFKNHNEGDGWDLSSVTTITSLNLTPVTRGAKVTLVND